MSSLRFQRNSQKAKSSTYRRRLHFHVPPESLLPPLTQRVPNHIREHQRNRPHAIRIQIRLAPQIRDLLPLVVADPDRRLRGRERLRHARGVLARLLDDAGEVAEALADAGGVEDAERGVLEGVHEPDDVLAQGGGGVGEELPGAGAEGEAALEDPADALFEERRAVRLV